MQFDYIVVKGHRSADCNSRCNTICACLCLILSTLFFFGSVSLTVWIFEYNYPFRYAVISFIVASGGLYITTVASSMLLFSSERVARRERRRIRNSMQESAANFMEVGDTNEGSLNGESFNLKVPSTVHIRKTPPPPYDDPAKETSACEHWPTEEEQQPHYEEPQVSDDARGLLRRIYYAGNRGRGRTGGSGEQRMRQQGSTPDMPDAVLQYEYMPSTQTQAIQLAKASQNRIETVEEIKDSETFAKALEQIRMSKSCSHLVQKKHDESPSKINPPQISGTMSSSQLGPAQGSAEKSHLRYAQNANSRSPSLALQRKLKARNLMLTSQTNLNAKDQRPSQTSLNCAKQCTSQTNLNYKEQAPETNLNASRHCVSQVNLKMDGRSHTPQTNFNAKFSTRSPHLNAIAAEQPIEMVHSSKSPTEISQLERSVQCSHNRGTIHKAQSFGSLPVNGTQCSSNRCQMEVESRETHVGHLHLSASKPLQPGRSREPIVDNIGGCQNLSPEEWITAWNLGFDSIPQSEARKILGVRL